MKFLAIISALFCILYSQSEAQSYNISRVLKDPQGAIFKADTNKKVIYLIFTAHDFADGKDTIIKTLKKNKIKASFFFTGDFYRNYPDIIQELKEGKHYLGAHSDKHLLYCDWNKRDSMLVSDEELLSDLHANYREMKKSGISKKKARFFMPPYEWYNTHVVELCKNEGLQVINFSPGTSSNADYTTPEMKNYLGSEAIVDRIFQYEKKNSCGLNGFHLLIHFGCAAERTDKLYYYLDELICNLRGLGYTFKRFI